MKIYIIIALLTVINAVGLVSLVAHTLEHAVRVDTAPEHAHVVERRTLVHICTHM